jgi:hypothetical protein
MRTFILIFSFISIIAEANQFTQEKKVPLNFCGTYRVYLQDVQVNLSKNYKYDLKLWLPDTLKNDDGIFWLWSGMMDTRYYAARLHPSYNCILEDILYGVRSRH